MPLESQKEREKNLVLKKILKNMAETSEIWQNT